MKAPENECLLACTTITGAINVMKVKGPDRQFHGARQSYGAIAQLAIRHSLKQKAKSAQTINRKFDWTEVPLFLQNTVARSTTLYLRRHRHHLYDMWIQEQKVVCTIG